MEPTRYLDYGALGAAVFVMLVAMAILFRVLMWVREMMNLVLDRLQENTRALVHLADRVNGDHLS